MATPIVQCRICESRSLEEILSLGNMPAVNSFLVGAEAIASEKKHPLAIAFCAQCSHVQLTQMLDPEAVFTDYVYLSSMSETVVRWGIELAERYRKELSLTPQDLVAELASNDGCILKAFASVARIQGVEPAQNIAAIANREGIPTLAKFFDAALGKKLRADMGAAKLIIARNVLAHVPTLVDFVRGAREWLADDGVFHVEVPYLDHLVRELQFDTIYHEHLSYFSLTALAALFERAGLVLWDVEEIPLHGGSLIVRGKRSGPAKPSVQALLEKESKEGLTQPARLREFARQVQHLKVALPTFLRNLKSQHGRMAAYGAAAKGVVLTNYCQLGPDLLEFAADRNPWKQGKLMPGVHIPVFAPERLLEVRPSHVLVLAWNFFDEIARQLKTYQDGGGRLVIPIPQPRVHSPRVGEGKA